MGKRIKTNAYALFAALFLFAACLTAQDYVVTDPDTGGILGTGAAFDINESGIATGIGMGLNEFYSGAIWAPGEGTLQLPILEGDEFGEAYDITEAGVIAGTSVNVVKMGSIWFFYNHAVTWVDGEPILLADVVYNPTGMELWTVTCMNDNGQLCGWGRPDNEPPSHGFYVEDGVAMDLGQGTMVADINNQGQFVGYFSAGGLDHAFVWDDGTIKDLHDPAYILGFYSHATAINECGQVVGYSRVDGVHETATVWENGEAYSIGTLGGTQSMARDINDHGTIVGVAQLGGGGGMHAFIYRDGTMLDMNDLIAEPTDSNEWVLWNAHAIANNGTIVGDAFYDGSGPRPFVAVPDTNGKFRIYGSGCAGSGGYTPALHGQGDPTSGGDVSMVCVNGLGGAYGILFFGTGYDTIDFRPGCTVQILPLLPIHIPLFLDGATAGSGWMQVETQLPVGITPGTINMQILFADPEGPSGYTVTNPLEMVVQ